MEWFEGITAKDVAKRKIQEKSRIVSSYQGAAAA